MIAAIYARKSTEQKGVSDEEKSVERQVQHARAFAAARGWTVSDKFIFVDDGISGAEFEDRPGFMRLKALLSGRAPFQRLVVSEISRLGREQLETGFTLKLLDLAGVQVVSYLDGKAILVDDPTQVFLMSAANFASDMERQRTRQRVMDAMLHMAKAGYVTGCKLYGYDNVRLDGHQHAVRRINVTEAAIVRRIFTRAVAGAGYARIARELTQEGVPAPRGPQWAPNSVRGILTNPIYFGGPTYYGKKMLRNRWGKKNKGTCLRPSSEWTRVPAGCDPLVTEATWHAAAALRAGKVAKMKAAGPRGGQLRDGDSRYLLSNFARCAVCGGPICAIGRDVGGGRAYFYACMNYHRRGRLFCTNATTVPVDKLNAEVLTALVKLVDHPGLIGRVIKAVIKMRTNGVRAATVTRLQADLVRLEGERERLVAACALGGDVTAFHAGVQEREHRLAALRAQVATLQQPMTGSDPALAKAVRQEFARWTGLITGTLPDARSFLRRMLAGPILLTPAPGDVLLPRHRNQFGPRKDTRAYQFEGRLALDTHFSGLATIRGAGTHSAEDWKPTFKGIAA